MKPSEVAKTLNRIATEIANSKNPDRRLVAQDLKKVLAALHSSGNPGDAGGYSLECTPVSSDEVLSIEGTAAGVAVSGKMTFHMKAGQFNGYDYIPNPGTFDIKSDENVLQMVLDACYEELNLHSL